MIYVLDVWKLTADRLGIAAGSLQPPHATADPGRLPGVGRVDGVRDNDAVVAPVPAAVGAVAATPRLHNEVIVVYECNVK